MLNFFIFKSMKLHIEKFTFNPFQENTYIIYSDTQEAVIIDPGCYFPHEQSTLDAFISEKQLRILAVLGTHAHIDHVLGNDYVCKKYAVPYYLHNADLVTLSMMERTATMYGFDAAIPSPLPTQELTDGQDLVLGSLTFKVIHTPGHCPGHVVFYNAENNFVINGDVLFAGSFGRVDLPGGDLETLKRSIKDKMFHLPEDTIVYCGHGPETTIGAEKRSNYILQY